MATEHGTGGDRGEAGATEEHDHGGRQATDGGALLSDVAFVRIGGLAEVVAVLLVLVSIVVSGMAGITPEPPAPGEMGAWLATMAGAEGAYVTISWLFVVDHLLEIVFVVALYRLTREAGTVARFALVAGVVGLFTVAVSGVAQLALAELAAGHAAAGEGARSGIVATAVAVEQVRLALNLVGTVLAWGVGGAIFSAVVLRTGVLPRWLGWLGLAFAGVIWLNALRLVSPAFEPLVVLMLLVGLVWLPGMGIALVRIDPERVPA